MKTTKLLFSLCLAMLAPHAFATGEAEQASKGNADMTAESASETVKTEKKKSRFTIGGYGEAVYSRNFYSDNYLRYDSPQDYKDDKHGRFDLPHVVLMLGYDFGKGWSMGMEIEFEHGGTESAVEIEEHEGGEYETEVERGGEVALEQFWIQKSFCPEFNIKLGHMVIPVGATNAHHLPTEFFGVYRPEGENTIMPCTWHETGLSIWGRAGDWRYEAMLLPGLDSDRFNDKEWIKGGAGSPYEFKIANAMAGAVRVDNYSVKGLRLSVSGYAGNTFSNTLKKATNAIYDNVKGTVLIGSFDFHYNDHNWVARGNFDYGHLSDAALITRYNQSFSNDSPAKKRPVATSAISTGVEVGYDLFGWLGKKQQEKGRKFYLFGRYEYYDSMYKTEDAVTDYEEYGRQRIAFGVNYYPMKDIVLKGEYSLGILKSKFNNEPAVSLGVAYSGFFNL
ncbi:hypothetical protein QVO32_11435 [Bacteroides gallinaceum]|uniref:hypothetical protein n=1 Tax=Bacteroides TaxID=816 RepID=UPI000B377FCE|nr:MULTISPECIES: hypothetical protein [Bacteroides]MDN0080015.1 hypothetical protein [Bacteroides gallinaceum]OUO80995.1 hypothetical protein B5F71_06420 [Bacteroides sp. An269]